MTLRPIQSAVDSPGSRPDVGEEIRAAQDQLLQVERAMAFAKDDSAPIFRAMAAFAGAMHCSKLEDDANRQAIAELIQSVKPAITADDIKALNKAAGQNLANAVTRAIRHLTIQMFRRAAVWTGIGVAVGALAIGAGAFWVGRWSVNTDPMAVTSCVPAPQPAGGEAVTCTFWMHRPTTGVH